MNTFVHVSTYRPRQCGNAEVAAELITSLNASRPDWRHSVAAINFTADEVLDYPNEVEFVIQQGVARDFLTLSQTVNSSPDVKLVHIHYEAGLFGEHPWKRSILEKIRKSSRYPALLRLLVPFRLDDYALLLFRTIKKPIIVTLWAPHTYALEKDYWLRRRLRTMTKASRAVIVHSRTLKQDLQSRCALPGSKLVFIPSGSLPYQQAKRAGTRKSPYPPEKFIFLSVGLLRPNQNFGLAIDALHELKEKYPNVQYWIVGAPHPRMGGEEYVERLTKKVSALNMEDRLIVKTDFLNSEEFINYIHHADVCVLPYRNRRKYASGVLAYSLACGTPCIATRFPYAVEYLSTGAGKLVEFDNVQELTQAMEYFVSSIERYNKAKAAAAGVGASLIWDSVITDFVELYERVMDKTSHAQ